MSEIRQFNDNSMRRIAQAIRQSEGGASNRRSRRRDPQTGDSSVWVRIESSSVVSAGQEWNYLVVIQAVTGAGAFGLADANSTQIPAKNLWEGLTLAGYENADITELLAIPDDAIVRAWWGKTGSTPTLIFSERNEPTCEVPA